MKNKDRFVHNLRSDFHMTQRTPAPVRFSDGLTGDKKSVVLINSQPAARCGFGGVLHFAKSFAKIGFQLVVRYLSAKRLEEFCKPRLRKFFHGLAEGPYVITDNQGCYAADHVGELAELSDHMVKSVPRHGFASGVRYGGRNSCSLKIRNGRFLFACFQLLACDNCADILGMNTSQSFCLS